MLTLVLGGARSGKSRHAQSLAGDGDVVYIATAVVGGDAEMAERVERHQRERPSRWTTVEAPLDVAGAVASVRGGAVDCVIVDCVTVWLSNVSYAHRELSAEERGARIDTAIGELVESARGRDVILVSNDVGSGIVPDSPVAREFRDLHGRANQTLAAAADRVVLMVAGLPLPIKPPAE